MGFLYDFIKWFFSGIGLKLFDRNPEEHNRHTITVEIESVDENQANANNLSSDFFVVDKFFRLFESHGIIKQQIPDVIPPAFSIRLEDLVTKEALIKKIDGQLLDYLRKAFRIRRAWFDEPEGALYETLDVYKDEFYYLDILLQELKSHTKHINVYFMKNFEHPEEMPDNEFGTDVLVVIGVDTYMLSNKKIQTFILLRPNLRWGYWKSRHCIKRLIYITEILTRVFGLSRIYMHGYTITKEEYALLMERRELPVQIINNAAKRGVWYPEDYCHTEEENQYDARYMKTLKEIGEKCKRMAANIRGY